MEAFLISTGIVAIAEIGDKTQLLSLLLAARFRRPWPIVLGILAATLANHAAAGAVGNWFAGLLDGQGLRWAVGLSFLAVAGWALIPDKLDAEESPAKAGWGAFTTTLVSFFLAEIGDKTQVATVMLATQFHGLAWVVLGTTLGMMLANVPAVMLGHAAGSRFALSWVRYVAAGLFALMGALVLAGMEFKFG